MKSYRSINQIIFVFVSLFWLFGKFLQDLSHNILNIYSYIFSTIHNISVKILISLRQSALKGVVFTIIEWWLRTDISLLYVNNFRVLVLEVWIRNLNWVFDINIPSIINLIFRVKSIKFFSFKSWLVCVQNLMIFIDDLVAINIDFFVISHNVDTQRVMNINNFNNQRSILNMSVTTYNHWFFEL